VRNNVEPVDRLVELSDRNRIEFPGHSAIYRDPNTDKLEDYRISAKALVDIGAVRAADLPAHAFMTDRYDGWFRWWFTYKVK